MKAIKIALVMILALNLLYSLQKWLFPKDTKPERYQLSQNSELPLEAVKSAGEGLDLKSITVLVKEIRSGQELERKLNETGGINNLDLNDDDNVDYIFVREYGEVENKIGYSLTVKPVKGETQEVATVEVERNKEKAEIQVIGNEQIYGTNAIYNDWTPIEREVSQAKKTGMGSTPMYSSYFYPRPLWFSPFFFGYYPPFYSFYPVVATRTYVNRVGGYKTSGVKSGKNSFQKSSARQLKNPNKGKFAKKGISRSLKKPTATQKQFQTTRRKNLKSGGFGRSRSVTGKSSSLGSTSRGSSTRSGFSGSSRFGGSSRSFNSGSFRSRGFGSRSFSFGK